VRLDVEVPAGELEGRLERKATQLGRKLKLPGFRRGKVPAPLVIQRMGREAVLEATVRDEITGWYSDAIETAGVVPVGDPQLDLGDLPGQGEALEFAIEIGVLPPAQLGAYEGLKVARREPQAEPEQIQQEIDTLRERLARLKTTDRPAAKGDFLVVDYEGSLIAEGSEGEQRHEGFPAGEGRDQLIELGAGSLMEDLEENLLGARAGETPTVELSFPADHANRDLAGRRACFTFTVKEVKLKELPDVDDELAIDAGFDSLEDLREDIRRRLLEIDESRIEAEFLGAALDAAVAEARVEMWERTLRSLAERGISRESYLLADRQRAGPQPADLRSPGSESLAASREQEVLNEIEPSAEQALRREAVLTAIVAAEGIQPTEEELLEAIVPAAERDGIEPQKLLEELRERGRLEELREDLAARQAVALIAARATPIPVAEAQAKERLWTPAKARENEEGAAASSGLWTPGR
jgi:trigger factor